MSLLKTNLEDLLMSKTNDARKVAKATLAHDKDDLVSNPDRKTNDEDPQGNIDKALSTGRVYQEEISSTVEQSAYVNYKALKSIIDPISGNTVHDTLSIQNICEASTTISEFSENLYKESIKMPYKQRKSFDEKVDQLMEQSINHSVEDVILWKSLISNLENE